MSDKIRSIIFNFFFFFGSLFLSIALLWTLLLPRRVCTLLISKIYAGYVSFIEKHIMGITLELRGLENLPKDSLYIIAAKHQSAFETLILPYMAVLKYPTIVLKKELTYIPLWGWYPLRMGFIAIDRGSGSVAIRSIVRGSKRSVAEGRPIVIFPEGTRTKVGETKKYKVGIAKIYHDLGVPVVPMALNSGLYWGKNSFFKKSGKVIFEFLPPIEPGLEQKEFMHKLELELEKASNALIPKGKEHD